VLLDRGANVGEQLPPGQQRIPRGIADNTTAAMIPIAGYSNGHNLSGARPSAAKTGTTQLGDTKLNKDAWMIGYTPSLSTAVWVGTEQSQPIQNTRGADIYGSGLPADIWKQIMDGALDGTPVEQFPAPAPASGQPNTGKPSGGTYDILNPPPGPAPAPVIVIPPAPQPPKEVEIFPA